MSKNYLKFLIITASIVSAAMLSGLSVTGLWKNSSEYWPPIGGYQYYRDSNDYLYEKSAVQIDALEIDLRFLDSGRHITIYDDGVCQIKIYDIRFTRITDDDGKLLDCYYTIGLGSFGKVTKITAE